MRLAPIHRLAGLPAATLALAALTACDTSGTTCPEEAAVDVAPEQEPPLEPDGPPDEWIDPAPLAPLDPHGLTVLDLLDMRRLADPQVSPDGDQVAFVVRVTDLEANRSRSDLWLVDLAGGEPRRLTRTPESESSPRWSADASHLYYTVADGDGTAIRSISLEDGQTTTLRTFPLPVAGLVVAPKDAGFLVAADVFPACETLECTAERLGARADEPSGRAYDRLFVRHWDTWKDGRRSHLWYVPAEGGAPVDLTHELDADVPSKPFGGLEEVTFTPDGREVVFGARVASREEAWSTNFDLYAVPITGGTPRQLTTNPAWDAMPRFSPDGKTLAYVAMARPGFEADRFRLTVMDWPSGKPRTLTEGWDRSVRELVWAGDGQSLVVTAQDVGQVSLFRVDVARGKVTPLLQDGTVSSPAFAHEQLVFLRDDLTHPAELHRMTPGTKLAEPLTDLNRDRLERARMGDFEQFTFKGARGDTVHGYVVKPADFREGERYPIAFLIHGGPQGSFGNHFHYRWNPQVYAGAGYAAVMIDFHGSTGYGQDFTDAIRRDWGGKPLVDLKKGLAAALARYPFLDGERACALGASYGGFMINWIAGRWPDRFKCLVNHDGVFDQRSMYFSTEELWFPEWEQGGPYWERPDRYERHNPALHVKAWKTPMLVVHGSLDYRVPIEQGLAAFTALQRQGIESRFLHFPDENHWVLHPKNSIQWHEEVLGWLAGHLGQAPAAP